MAGIPEELFGAASGPPPTGKIPEELLGPAPGETAGPPERELGWSDIRPSAMAGLRQGTSDVGQTLGQPGWGETHPASRPFALSDITHPASGLSKLAYRTASSYPALAGGVGAGAIGTAATGNPLVGLGSGALGAAAGSVLQTLGPALERELSSGASPDEAWSRAKRSAALAGGFTAAAWAAFPAKFVEGPIKNAAFQIFGVQPGLAATHQATENIMHDRPVSQGTGEAAIEGVIGTAVPMGAAKAVGRVFGKGDTAAQTLTKQQGKYTAADLEDVANKHYGEIEGLKTDYTNLGELQKVQKDIRKTLINEGGNPRHDLLGKGVFDTIDELTQPAEPGQTIDFGHIDNVRKMLNGYLSANEPNVRRLARHAINGLDEWVADAKKQEAAGLTPDVAAKLAQTAEKARSYWHAAKGMKAWDRVQERIDNSTNPESARRSEIRRIVNNPKLHWQYPPEAIDLMRASLEKGFLDKVNAISKWFDPHSSTGLITDFLLHHFSGPMGLAAPVVAALIGRHVQKPLERTTEGVPHVIRHAPTGNIPAPLGVRGRTEQGYSPFVGPVTPQPQQQQFAEGGSADMPVPRRTFRDRVYSTGAREPGKIEDRTDPYWVPSGNVSDYFPPRLKQPMGSLENDIGRYDIGSPYRGFQDGGEVGDTPFDDPMFKQALEAQGPEQRQSRSDILKDTLAPSYLRDTPSSPQADAALANPFAPAGKIGPPSGPPTTIEKMGGLAADVGSSLIPGGKTAAALKGMFLPAPAYAAERAAKMLKLGQTPKEVWDQYGIFQDAAGHWRQEVSGPTRQRIGPEAYKGQPIKSTLSGVVDMPHLYKEAPFMERLPMTIGHPQSEPESTLGSYYPDTRSFFVRPTDKANYPMRNTIWHETQHAIDHPARMLEHPGGDPEWYEKGMKGLTPDDPLWQFFKKELGEFGYPEQRLKEPLSDPKFTGVKKPFGIASEHLAAARGATEYQRYKRSVSEVIARNAEHREAMYNQIRDRDGGEAARRWLQENPPQSTEDYPRELQLTGGRPVRQRGGKISRALAVARRAA